MLCGAAGALNGMAEGALKGITEAVVAGVGDLPASSAGEEALRFCVGSELICSSPESGDCPKVQWSTARAHPDSAALLR